MKRLLLLACALVLTGCVNVVEVQTLHRDSTMDVQLTFSAGPEVLQGFRNVTINPDLQSSYSYSEAQDNVTYTFTRIPLNATLFKGTSLLPGETHTLVRRYGFPFNSYTYTIQFAGLDSLQQFSSTANVSYVVKSFGTVTWTNGRKLDSRTVMFSPLDNSTEVVVFREFFLCNWLCSK